MPVLKNKTQKNFTIVSNEFFHDHDLSMKDRGVLCTLCSLPDGWDFSISGLSAISHDGQSAIRASIHRLEHLGYLKRKFTRDENGKYITEIEVFMARQAVCDFPPRQTRDGKSDADNPPPKNRRGLSAAENLPQYNNHIKTDIKNPNKVSINQSTNGSSIDRQMDVEAYKQLIAKNIKLKNLLDVATRHGETEVTLVNEIYDTICDMVCYQRDTVTIKGTSYPWDTVKSRFLKLNNEHIADLLNRLVDADLKIKNMQNYLISALYTASLVGTLDSEASLHDDYLKHLRGKPY